MKHAIAFDARMIGMGGIGRYAESLLKEMLLQRPAAYRWILVGDPARLKPIAASGSAAAGAVEIRESRARIYSVAEAFRLGRTFAGADLVHVPHFNAPVSGVTGKLIVTLHDLIHFDYPEYQPFPGANRILDWKLRTLLRRADGMLTVSQASADALERRYPGLVSGRKLRVTLEAAENGFSPDALPDDAERLQKLGADPQRPYVLYVGAIREHKQVHILMDAFESLQAEGKAAGAQLLLVGGLDRRYDRKRGVRSRLGRNRHIRHIAGANDADLAALYRRAELFVLPSAVEGFGLPVIEAMRSGSAVAVSDAPALREIGGAAVHVFPVGDVPALKNILGRALSDPLFRNSLRKKSAEHVRRPGRFEWSATAARTLEFYDEILAR